MTDCHAQLTWRMPDIETMDPLDFTTHTRDRTTIDSLPGELLLDIASQVGQADAVCLCLATKRCFSVLAAKHLKTMKLQVFSDTSVLNALERDLPWNCYVCYICRKIHKFAYEQGVCSILVCPWSSPHDDASRILQNNIRVAKRRFLAESFAQGGSIPGLSLTYHYKKLPLGFWGYLEVKPGQNGNLYLRCQNWLRWTDNMWKYTDSDEHYNFGFHDGFVSRRSCQHNYFDSIRFFRNRSRHTLDKILPKTRAQSSSRAQVHRLTTEQSQHTKLPKTWFSIPMFACGGCETDVTIDLGFSPVPLESGQDGPKQAERQTWSALTRRAAATMQVTPSTKGRFKTEPVNGKSSSSSDSKIKYWCDTMVITEWRCIGPPHLFAEVYRPPARIDYTHMNWTHFDYWSPRTTEPEYRQGDAKTAFDGIPDQPYHPIQTKLNPLPLWRSGIPPEDEFEMPVLMSRVGHTYPAGYGYRLRNINCAI